MASDAPFSSDPERAPTRDLQEKPSQLSLSEGHAGSDGNDAIAAAPKPRRETRGFRWILMLSAIYSSMFIQSLDNTITADLVPAITNAFASVDLLPWVSVGFMVGAYVAMLPMGKLYARLDAKRIYVAMVVLFLAASALCGAAPTMPAMIVGRVFLGVAGSGLYCGIMTLIAVLADEHEAPLYFSITGVVWCVGTVLGPVVGGGFALVDWRWAFYINLIIGGVFMPVYLFVLPSVDPLPGKTLRERTRNFDLLGTVLLTGSVICLVMAINFGGVLYAWNGGRIIALFVVGGLLAVAFSVQQRLSLLTTPADRMFPAPLLRHHEPVRLFLSTICSNAASFVPIYYIPLYFQFTRGDSALEAAVRLLPLIILFGISNLAQGIFLVRVGYYWPWFFAGGALSFAGNLMLYFIDVNTSPGYIYGAEVILALGLGLCNQTPYGVIHSVIPRTEMSLGVPFIMFAQYTGITASLSICGAVFVNGGLKDLMELLPGYSSAQLNSILSGTSSSGLDSVPPELRGAVIDALVSNLRKTFIPAFFASAVVLLVSIFLKKRKLTGGHGGAVIAG